MDQEAFYKDQYDRALDRKNEIDTSMSIPIGILTALMGGFLFALANFNFDDNLALIITFVVIDLISVYLLARSVQFLLGTLTDLQNGIDYKYLIDADELDQYYKDLLTFYNAQPNATKAKAELEAKKDLDEYVLADLIGCAGINQRNNFSKIARRFRCYRYMIYAIISLSLLIIPFGIDFGISKGKDKVEKIKIDSAIPVILTLKYKDTTERLNLKPASDGKPKHKKTDTAARSNN